MVGFGEAVGLFFKRYTDFQGRSRRSEYWWAYLFNFLVVVVPYVLVGVLGMNEYGELNVIGMVLMGIVVLYVLAVLIPNIAISIRRLHDRNMSGWWLLLSLIPYIGGLVLLVFYVLPGTSGPNKYGPDPKGGLGMAGAATFD